MNKKFALIGAAGFVAPRHMKAIRDTGNTLVAAMDPNDSVGVMDSYFPEAAFFTEFERFDRHLEKLKRGGKKVDFLSICSPNYLHDAHIRFGLRYGSDVICEKPMVLNPYNIEPLMDMEKEGGFRIYNILQLRLHPSILDLKKKVENSAKDKKYDVDLTYITTRGQWYYTSWKGQVEKSGGIATNIGVHFFDMLQWVFGKVQNNIVHIHTHDRAAGFLEFENARVRWFLSINSDTLPEEAKTQRKNTYRSIKMNEEEWEFSEGFTDLHTVSYQHIFTKGGFGIKEVLPSTEIIHQIRTTKPIGLIGEYHLFCEKPLINHPFLKV